MRSEASCGFVVRGCSCGVLRIKYTCRENKVGRILQQLSVSFAGSIAVQI